MGVASIAPKPRTGRRQGALWAVPTALAVFFVIAGLAACASPPPASSASLTAGPLPSVRPFAPAVTPSPGQPFVGYWGGARTITYQSLSYEVLAQGKGSEVSENGDVPVSYPLVKDRLILSTANQYTQGKALVQVPSVQLIWKQGRLVLAQQQVPSQPVFYQPLKRLDRAAYVKAVEAVVDRATRKQLFVLAQAIAGWAQRPGYGPPDPRQLWSGSEFARWLFSKSQGQWHWPVNYLTDKPMTGSGQPGDFTYIVEGHSWKLVGHLTDGRTFDVPTAW